MPREIKTTIAVDGEAAFKRAINDANTSMRNLGSQLTLATAQFKKDGDAMKLMETRSKALKSEIDQQEEIVKALEKAVSDSSKAYGENSEKTEKWEAELNRAKAKLTNLQSELTLNNAGLDRNGKAFDDSSEKAADYQATLQTVGKGISFENITSGIHSITTGFEGAVKKIFGFAKAMRDTMVDAGQWADDLMTDATKYGMDVETLQRWRNAADFIDTDVETIVKAKDKLSQKITSGWFTDLDKGAKYNIKTIDEQTGALRDEMDILFDVGELLKSMANTPGEGGEIRAEALAMELFGKSYRELLPLFNAGQAEWERTVADQRVVSEEHVRALGEMDDANQQLENSWETLKYTALAEIAPVLTEATNALSNLLNEFNDWIETDEGKQAMSELAAALQELFSGLGDIKFQDAIKTAKEALQKLKEGLEWINKHKDDVKLALEAIGIGFAALKVADVALNVGEIVSGFQTLWSGANKKLPTLPGTDSTPTAPTAPTTPTASPAADGTDAAKKSPFAVIGNFLRSPAAKALGGTAAFGAVLFQNAYTAQGNDDVLDESGELTNDAILNGFYKDENGEVRNRNAEAVTWSVTPKANAETAPQVAREEIVEDVDLDPVYTLADKIEAAQDWWDAYRNAENGVDTYEEEENAFEHLQEALGDGFGDFWDAFLEKTDGMDTSGMEDLPDSILDAISGNNATLDDAVAQMKINTESNKAAADKVAGMDIRRFNSLPTELQGAVMRGAASGVSGITVRLDGATVGRLVAPYVNAYLGLGIYMD